MSTTTDAIGGDGRFTTTVDEDGTDVIGAGLSESTEGAVTTETTGGAVTTETTEGAVITETSSSST